MKFKTYSYKEIDNIAFELLNEKAIIMPTDTIVGILSLKTNLIYQIKNRSLQKKIVKFILDYNEIPNLDETQIKFLEHFWPGPLTIIKDNISYRIPNDKYILYLISKVGSLYCSSANLSNANPITEPIDANAHFNIRKHFYNLIVVDEPAPKDTQQSTIVNIDTWQIIRQGEKFDEITKYINENAFNDNENYLLIDATLSKYEKEFKKIKNVNLKIKKLNYTNFKKYSSEIINNNNNILIITNLPYEWDLIANKIKYVRSGIVYSNELASLIKQHDNTNVAIFDLNEFNIDEIKVQVKKYLQTKFEGGRHLDRVQTIIDFENEN